MNDPARRGRHLPWIALVPPLVIALLVFGLGVDVPYWDTWDWLDRHYPADQGAVSMLRRYWTPFNGHRVFLPLLLDRALLELSTIDMWPRICAKLLLSLATLAALLAMVRIHARARADLGHRAQWPPSRFRWRTGRCGSTRGSSRSTSWCCA